MASPNHTRSSLATYRKKRDFRKTAEPRGGARRRTSPRTRLRRRARESAQRGPIFVIQQHDATNMHYDFRLEVDGVLKSWAVPKGPSMNPADKRLAVQVEDHPIEYSDFEGIIPEGEYGGGTVIVWDTGTYRNLREEGGNSATMNESLDEGRVKIWLEGRKLHGGFALVRSSFGPRRNNWLLIKLKDSEVDAVADPVRTKRRSVISGKTIEQMAKSRRPRVWKQ